MCLSHAKAEKYLRHSAVLTKQKQSWSVNGAIMTNKNIRRQCKVLESVICFYHTYKDGLQ
ncbi:hypothetical protein Plhal304r1_c089g0170891 [Plasmopara halstedii]